MEPWKKFLSWHRRAVQSKEPEPNAMALATISKSGAPSVRMVLYKNLKSEIICFVTNYQSRKAHELSQHANAVVLFFWPSLGLQIRMEGQARKVSASTSEEYWRQRPRESQIAAWASLQSRPMKARKDLANRLKFFSKKFAGRDVPRSKHWGAFELKPKRFEFWEARSARLHHREEYTRVGSRWRVRLLYP